MFKRDVRASIATIAAIAFPVLAVAVAAVAELAEVQVARTELQNDVDAAALKGAGELSLDQSSATAERARAFANSLAKPLNVRWTVQTQAQANPSSGSMTITQTATRGSLFGNLVPPGGFHLTVTATASANSTTPLCVLATKAGSTKVLSVANSAAITAGACLVQSDSDIQVNSGASLTAGSARSVGAATGTISPAAVTDSPSVPDPFASLPINVPTTCSDHGLDVNGSQTLAAGVHCGNIQLQGSATLTLASGEHYFVNADLNATGNVQVSGTDVVLILSGTSALQFQGNASLSLDGRQSGTYAGFALVSDRSYTGTVNISTKAAHELLGTVYLPAASLSVSGNGNKVADSSPWTVVVVSNLLVQGSANLVINSNYSATVVPVPAGVGPGGGTILLTR